MKYQVVKNVIGAKQVRYECPKCGTTLKNPLSQAGQKDTCPECRAVFVVPGIAEKQRDEQEQQLKADQAAQQKQQKAQRRAAAAAQSQASPAVPNLAPMAKPVGTGKPRKTGLIKNADVLQFAIDSTRTVISVVFLLAAAICGLAFLLGAFMFFVGLFTLSTDEDQSRTLMSAVYPGLILMGLSIVYLVAATLITGTIGVLFRIEENTRPH